ALDRWVGERGRGVQPAPRRRDAREARRRRAGAPSGAGRAGGEARLHGRRGQTVVIRIERLRKTYGSLVAVDDLSLEVSPGTVLGFLGRNGAGKTTTIRMMVGLLEPTAGTVVLDGHDIRRAPESAKAVTGYLPDRPHLYDKLTGHEYLTFVAGLYRVRRGEARNRAAALLEQLGLAPQSDELIQTFSHRTQQRAR